MASTALTLPAFDPWAAVRALAETWVFPTLGNAARRALTPFAVPLIGETVAMLSAGSVDEFDRLLAAMERRNRRRATLAFPALYAWGKSRSMFRRRQREAEAAATLEELRQRARTVLSWWEGALKESGATEELQGQADMALYSMLRSVFRWLQVLVDSDEPGRRRLGRRVGRMWPSHAGRILTAFQVWTAALIAVLVQGREHKIKVREDVAQVLVKRMEADADEFSRFIARVVEG